MTSNPRRIVSIWLPHLAIDRWRLEASDGSDLHPVALTSEAPHGPRIVAVNDLAREAGVRANTRLADMRALCPELKSVGHDPAGDRATLEAMALWAQRWGPHTALDPPDAILADCSGAAHLFGGEAALLSDIVKRLEDRGYVARVGMAATAGAAWAMSHYATKPIIPANSAVLDYLGPLPVAALRLDGDVQLLLRRLGVKRIADLQGIARPALARRFRNRRASGANPLIRLDQLLGITPEPLLPVAATHAPLVQRRLADPLLHRSLLDRVLADLAAYMANLLEAQRMGARRLLLRLFRVDGETMERRLELASASRDVTHIIRLFADKLDDIDAGFGIDQVQLLSPWIQSLELHQQSLEEEAENGISLATAIDRLTARLGAAAITRPVSHASHLSERSQRWVEPLSPTPTASGQGALAFHGRPPLLLDRAEPIEVVYGLPEDPPRRFRWRGHWHVIARMEGPERIAPEWWRARSATRLRDYYTVEDERGGRFWIYRDGIINDGRGGLPEWYLQGVG